MSIAVEIFRLNVVDRIGCALSVQPAIRATAGHKLAVPRDKNRTGNNGSVSQRALPVAYSVDAEANVVDFKAGVPLQPHSISRDGVWLQWHTSFEVDNVGFSIYRISNGQRSLANTSIIPGSVFVAGDGKLVPGGRSYRWLDRQGTADSIYYIESEDLNGNRHSYQPLIYVSKGKPADNQQSIETLNGSL